MCPFDDVVYLDENEVDQPVDVVLDRVVLIFYGRVYFLAICMPLYSVFFLSKHGA